MKTVEAAPADNRHSVFARVKSRWLNPRRKRFWAIVVILLYSLLGFFAAPSLIRNYVTGFVQEDLGRSVRIEKIEVNPFVLSLRVRGFELSDTDDVKLAAFDELFLNFQLSSLINWAWSFGEIRMAGPYFYFERLKAGDSRLDHLLIDFEKSQPVEEPGTDVQASLPRLLIHNLTISDGRVDILDNVPGTAVETQLAPINITMQELNTLPDRDGRHTVTIRLPDDASASWSGSLNLVPFESEGQLELQGLHLDPAIAYLQSMLPLETFSATLSSRFQYRLYQHETRQLGVEINGLEIDLQDLLIRGLTPVTDFVEIPKITLRDGSLRYPEQSLHFGAIGVENPSLAVWINKNGSLSLEDLIAATAEEAGTAEAGSDKSPWQLGIDEFTVAGGRLAFSDRSLEPNAMVGVTALRVNISEISNADDASMPFDLAGGLEGGGSYTLNGSVTVLPNLSFSATASTHDIPLSLGQPYVQQYARIDLEYGLLDSDVEVSMPAGEPMRATGSFEVPGLEISDGLEQQRLLGWGNLEVDQFDLNDDRLQLSQLTLANPFGRLAIHKDRSTNVSDLLIEQAPGSEDDESAVNVVIGGIRVEEGSMDFSDASLPLPFATHITGMDGSISTITTNSATPATIRLEGQVDEYGLARINGDMNVLDPVQHTDVSVEFRNLLMSSLSPYTVQFAGRKIDDGKLDIDLVYAIDEGQLHGNNDVVLSDLILGDKVDHPEAGSLPLGLAVSLLKDADGVIRVDLPVDGDINDPEFRIGGVIWQAVAGLITKVVSAPFRFLANLVGIDSEDLGQFEFLAGRADLTPPELEKVARLKEALMQRPELDIEISGVSARQVDIPALQFIRLRSIASERLGEGLEDKDSNTMMLDEKIHALVETMFSERFPDVPLKNLRIEHTVPPANDAEGKPVLDQLAYTTDLWNRMLAAEVISDQDLEDLANARAEAIRTAFLAGGQFDESRVVIAAPGEGESEDGEWVILELGVAAD